MSLPRIFRSATFRFAGLYLLFFTISVGLLAVFLFFHVRDSLEDDARNQISNEFNLLLFEFHEDGLDELLEETEERIEKNSTPNRFLYMVQSPSGRVIFDRIDPVSPPYGWQYITSGRSALFYFEELSNGYVLGVGKDLAALTTAERAIQNVFLWGAVVVLLIGALGGFLLSRRLLAIVDAITRTAKSISDGHLNERIPLQNTGDEFDELGKTLNQMLDRIELLVANIRQVSTGIAHDLRTPLARLRGRLETMRQNPSLPGDDVDSAIAEVDAILQTFAALLRLAELETGTLKAGFGSVALKDLVEQMVEAYGPIAEDSGKQLILEDARSVSIAGDKNLLQQLLANLLENALEHGGSTVQVSLQLKGKTAYLEVADNGPGIPAEARSQVIKPFQKGETSHGTGLGLALVVAIVQLHGGTLELADNHPGLLCRATFPIFEV